MVLDSNLIIYGQRTWCVLDLRGKLVKTNYFAGDGEIHNIRMLETLDSYSMISWTGDLADPRMVLETFKAEWRTTEFRDSYKDTVWVNMHRKNLLLPPLSHRS